MKSTVYALLLVGGGVLAQDISNPPATSTLSNQASATAFGTIDQPTATRPDYDPSQPSQPSQSSATLAVSTTTQPTAPLSPGLPTSPTSPTAPLSALVPQYPSQPTPSATPPAPIVVSSSDNTTPPLQYGAHALAIRTVESLQNMSNSLNNLIKFKTN